MGAEHNAGADDDPTRKWVKVSVDAMLKSKGKVNKKPPPLPFLPVSQLAASSSAVNGKKSHTHRAIKIASPAASKRVRTWVCERTTRDARKKKITKYIRLQDEILKNLAKRWMIFF
ncbi:hypothetical protein CEXT_109471 [Caerostris extrusa]|uniref:Uncharacterized protein n=1 Tax=Caerostris extrusa TaxID=172846 RepID=A0AAV4WRY0_CAEEX|nr:hypothetical protein CEXT_109471 [Caerostris extrusa]